MSRTHQSSHLPDDKHAARAHTRRKLRLREERGHKSAKQCRVNERARLRQEALR